MLRHGKTYLIWKGRSFDTPEPHPPGYFIGDPFLRDDGDDFCSDCTPQGKASPHLEHKFKTEVTKVATLQGFAIYDLFYRFDDHVDTKTADWKSILVEVSPRQFREIYQLQPVAGELNPSYLLKVGSEEIVATSTSRQHTDPGNRKLLL